ncbi:hypothetical protein N5D99_11935 [Aeromonas caviae]|uniref:hypothetical protein n=1 Tax=Aeromonas caviae TaxID=648 RepID=UPI00244C4F66|nr:hypothetical protein [Aeromonas caviae]MDH1845590.1 hypothetical protein [Aeromonas caviae]
MSFVKNCIETFHNHSTKNYRLNICDSIIKIKPNLSLGQHEYIYGEPFEVEDLVNFDLVSLGTPQSSFSVVVLFLDEKKNKLGGKVLVSGVQHCLSSEEPCRFLKVGIRITGDVEVEINSFLIGDKSNLIKDITSKSKSIIDKNHIPSTLGLNTRMPLVIIETFFCDTETNQDIIDRYLSKLKNGIELISLSFYTNFIWCIYVSDDKAKSVSSLTQHIYEIGLQSRVLIKTYSHPEHGYGNENEKHIDKLRRPNSTVPQLREMHFSDLIKTYGINTALYPVVIRIALDDDDYFLPKHLVNVVDTVTKNIDRLKNNDFVLFGFDRIYISYQSSFSTSEVHDASMNRVMTGCKFVASIKNKLNYSPFAITEHFQREADSGNRRVEYVISELDEPSFMYNRHGVNFSNNNKEMYYTTLHATYKNVDITDFLRIKACLV